MAMSNGPAPQQTQQAREELAAELIQETQDQQVEDRLLRLQLESIENCTVDNSGKQGGSFKNDFEMALALQQSEMHSSLASYRDRRMARSMVHAFHSDLELARTIALQDPNALNDSINTAPENEAPNSQATDPSLEKNLNRLAQAQEYEMKKQYHQAFLSQQKSLSAASSSSTELSRDTPVVSEPAQPETKECTSCRDDLPGFDLALLPCRHDYCAHCLTKLFTDCMVDRTLFPPRCCRINIDPRNVLMFLDSTVAEQFDEKKEELGATNPTYCHIQTCSAFMPSSVIVDNVGTCPKCGEKTCTVCNKVAHPWASCPTDKDLDALLDVAREAHWQRCFSCSSMVEMTYGCNHIVCRCGAEFCYNCGERWKTCECDQWSIHRLRERARVIYERRPPEQRRVNDRIDAVNAEAEATELNRIMQNLRENHECYHERWRKIRGRFTCEHCTDTMPNFIFECHECDIRACWRCRQNRL